ncbi:MAG: ATP-dependent sacrificial sulfur transferase LarE [Chloroflexi bacterium]|nr:ATP-dependent sacrificial sulfur transferase LarE [Chloroflexota bacterium]
MSDQGVAERGSAADLPRAQAERLTALRGIVAGYGRAVVAFSGGVDSALVAAVAAEQLGDDALAVTAQSPSLPGAELEAARELATAIGIRHRVVRTDELARPGYVANAGDRCYHCKSELYGHLGPIAAESGAVICNGTNRDDLGDYRPGLRAAAEGGVRSPLVEAGCGKADVRALARRLGLPVWDKPAAACLASRVPVGTPVSAPLLGEIEAAEAVLRGLGLRQVRVRHHGEIARIETDADGMAIVAREREAVERRLRGLGFRFVTLDLGGYRTGSLNPAGRDGAAP